MDFIKSLLLEIYGGIEPGFIEKLSVRLSKAGKKASKKDKRSFSQNDLALITYADTLWEDGASPISTLCRFAGKYLKESFSHIHLLPFFPFSSDDGFSVKDYYQVDPSIGSWSDIKRLRKDFKLIFDFVLNHISSQSAWFNSYLRMEKGFEELVIEVDLKEDLSLVVRPRTSPLLTPFERSDGKRVFLWTTFSADQVDLNYKSQEVLLKMVDVMLYYVERGADILRLDAVGFLWKEPGTSCIHLRQAHLIVKLFRAILDIAAPHVLLLTETNVPHEENVSYFGNGYDEAQLVYNFTLPPILLYSFLSEDSTCLTRWARILKTPSEETAFFNFTASHDGIGLRPVEKIIEEHQINEMVEHVLANNGLISYRVGSAGQKVPYELNITYVDALMKKDKESLAHVNRFLASQVIALVLPGIPGVYIHSLIGSRNWLEGVKTSKNNRRINREKIKIDMLERELSNPESFRSKIFYPYLEMLRLRRLQPAFHPSADFKILELDSKVFAIKRICTDQVVFGLVNLCGQPVDISLEDQDAEKRMKDILSTDVFNAGHIELPPYGCLWLTT